MVFLKKFRRFQFKNLHISKKKCNFAVEFSSQLITKRKTLTYDNDFIII